ncbi:MAG: 5-methylcytosine-specific restriction enzyme [Acidobacteriota bacterium]|jgi:putative restriction endonuclease|nr:5-methylcytosine-specific restriction enzyme [Acidobacteriota bacterium]
MFAVITENDESQWEDQTGVAYHFPKRYLDILKPGTQVIYYKGNLKNKVFLPNRQTPEAHYFGAAVIGRIYDDRNSTKNDKFAVIENYVPFATPVLIRQQGNYIERIPESRKVNYWRDGVRRIDGETYERILGLAGGSSGGEKAAPDTNAPQLDDVEGALESFVEGDRRKRYVTQYERNPKLRKLALLIHGYDCKGCGFNFEKVYGERGRGFIHVHHLKPVSEFDGPQEVDPEEDITVLCPNCHAMVHRFRDRTLSLEDLRTLVAQAARQGQLSL